MPQRADLHTGGGDGIVVVVVVAGTVLGGACWMVTGGGACSLVPQAERRTGTTRVPKARPRRTRAMVMTLLDSATATLLLLEPHFNAQRKSFDAK
jgi:hypothetical protein